MRRSLLLSAVLILAAAPGRAQGIDPVPLPPGGAAVPNFLGTTGLLYTPSAYTVGQRGISGHFHVHPDYRSYGFLFGPSDRIEAGLTLLDADSGFMGGSGTQLLANAKLSLLKESAFIPGIAVGVTDAFDSLDQGVGWYAVASKDLSRTIPLHLLDLQAHLGYGGGLFDQEVFAGLELHIGTPLDAVPVLHPRFSAMAELRRGEVDLGVRARWRGFAATVALFDLKQIGFGFSYNTPLRLR
jgi:hypothetical protein